MTKYAEIVSNIHKNYDDHNESYTMKSNNRKIASQKILTFIFFSRRMAPNDYLFICDLSLKVILSSKWLSITGRTCWSGNFKY